MGKAWFEELKKNLTSLKIQGAEHVARAAVRGITQYMTETGKAPGKKIVEELLATRPTEPMMRNAINYFLEHAKHGTESEILAHLLKQFDEADRNIARYASELIGEGGVYFTHCHSSTVIQTFLYAKMRGKSFHVRNSETRPLLQGRKTARELAAADIPVTYVVDSAAGRALTGCDAVFIGADALLSDGSVVNKIGSETIAELARAREIPVYILSSSWKFSRLNKKEFQSRMEKRPPKEVWQMVPRGVRINNPAFEFLHPGSITAIVTEQGIRDPLTTARELSKRFTDGKRK